MNALKWWNESTRMFFSEGADGSGGGSEAAPAPSGGDGGGSQPASSPPSSPAPSSTPSGGSEPFDWSALGSADDLDYAEIPAEPPPEEQPQEVPQPEPQAPAVAEPPKAAQPQVAQQPPAEAAKPLTAAEPWRIAEGLEANREAVVAHLAQSKFALSEEDIKDLDTDVTVAVPKLLARVFLESQISMQKFLAQAVPGMVKQYNTVTSANDGAEKQFFAAHKALDPNNPQHRATTVRIATIYRQANPNIPLNQLISEVGPMVMAALKVNGGTAQAGAPPPRAAAAFRPAVNGGGGLSPTREPANEWAGLGREYD